MLLLLEVGTLNLGGFLGVVCVKNGVSLVSENESRSSRSSRSGESVVWFICANLFLKASAIIVAGSSLSFGGLAGVPCADLSKNVMRIKNHNQHRFRFQKAWHYRRIKCYLHYSNPKQTVDKHLLNTLKHCNRKSKPEKKYLSFIIPIHFLQFNFANVFQNICHWWNWWSSLKCWMFRVLRSCYF